MDGVELALIDQRAHIDARLHAVAHFELRVRLHQRIQRILS